jgi:cytochrome P450
MAAVPAHVSPSAVVDFDYFHLPGADSDPFAAAKRLHAGPDLFWTPRNGGHWTVTRGAAIRRILADHENFSSRVVFIPRQQRDRFIPLEIDPPEHAGYRAMLTPALTPKAVAVWAQEARALAIALIEQFRPVGRCEFVGDFAQQLPIVVFLKMCGLPLEDRPMLLEWVSASLRPTSLAARDAAGRNLSEYVERWLARRRANPGGDLLSRIVTSEIGGRRLSEPQALSMGRSVLGGGLDTVAASMGFAALFLARHPDHVRQLVENPRLIPNAVDELLRRFAVPNIARVAARDVTCDGQLIREGELVFLPSCLHGLDERSFDDPLTVDFGRKNARMHSTFSQGIHNCPGATLARQEMRAFLEEWLQRIPRFGIAAGEHAITATGIVHAVVRLPLEWPLS